MKKNIALFSLLFFLAACGYCQKIQYSRGTIKSNVPAETQLVSNINGYHHLVMFTYNRKPSIHIFDPQLQLRQEKQLDFLLKKDCDVRLLSFHSHYYIYLHIFKPSTHHIWKVDHQGNAVSLTKNLQGIVDSFLNHSVNTLQLINYEGRLCITAQAYFDSVKTVRSTLIQLDDQFAPQRILNVLYPFDRNSETLQQTTLSKNALYVLKSSRSNEEGNSLHVLKLDLLSGQMLTTTFSSRLQFYQNPALIVNDRDTTVLVHSILWESFGGRMQRSVLISRLNNELREQAPLAVLRSQFRQNTLANFILVEGQLSLWINMFNNRMMQGITRRMGPGLDTISSTSRTRPFYGYMNYSNYGQATAVRLTLLDNKFKIKTDSLIENNGKIVEVQSFPFAQFVMNDKGYLVLIENFTPKRKGLLVLGSNSSNQLVATPLTVYDRYDYLLPQMQFVDEKYIVLPFVAKREIGLVKITMTPNENGDL